ncbi:nitroreductase family protein [Ramlibacter sp. H39-3-26]|nr:nitroreductase family protein [Ramlibacter sp. H39-3-26]
MLAYHARTKHRLERYAAGPETLDWDAQPDPFRRFAGAPATLLPLPGDGDDTPWSRIFAPGAVAPRWPSRDSVGLLFELSFALSAWKQSGPDRWALRCTPSSGNLHPTEAYLLTRGVADLEDGLHHYAPREHALELRARTARPDGKVGAQAPRLLVGLSSIHWREAWKYGERAFRYCQLDIGHAIGALRYAAAVLGWRVQAQPLGHAAIARLLGLDRAGDFTGAEREEAEALFELRYAPDEPASKEDLLAWIADAAWSGRASRIDARPMYRWPVIDEVALASRRDTHAAVPSLLPLAARHLPPDTDKAAAALIRLRRSAQQFDRRARLDAERFWPIAAALMPATVDAAGAPLPWDVWTAPVRVHAVLFPHRIDGLAPGAYLLPREASAHLALRAALPQLAWRRVEAAPPEVPLYEMAATPTLAGTLRTLSCHQAIGADAIFVVALLAEFHPAIDGEPWRYRELLREAGLVGQVLYLEAEAAGLRGTGIGCYFDDSVHALLGLAGNPPSRWQVVYHFSVGLPLIDPRITTEAPYDRYARQEATRP